MESAGAGVWVEATRGGLKRGRSGRSDPSAGGGSGGTGKEGLPQVFCSRPEDETGGLGLGKDKRGEKACRQPTWFSVSVACGLAGGAC